MCTHAARPRPGSAGPTPHGRALIVGSRRGAWRVRYPLGPPNTIPRNTKGETMRHVMAVTISGSTDGHDWPQVGEDAPDWLTEDTLRHMVAQNQVRIVIAPGVKPEPAVEISRPTAPEVRARQRRTQAKP